MKKNREDVLVVAPHPDDETLGCGGALLRHKAEGARLHWLILTAMPKGGAWSPARMAAREKEILAVAKAYGFASVTQLGYPAARLDAVPRAELVGRMVEVFKKASPRVVYVPHRGDVHSDHRVAAEAAAACVKWFRQGSVKRVLAYEALSETDLSLDLDRFAPTVFVDVSKTFARKLRILGLFKGELARFPFPRSRKAVSALAAARGAASGFRAAEAFMLLRELV